MSPDAAIQALDSSARSGNKKNLGENAWGFVIGGVQRTAWSWWNAFGLPLNALMYEKSVSVPSCRTPSAMPRTLCHAAPPPSCCAQSQHPENDSRALRDAVEPVAHIVAWRGESRDVDTRLYRYSFDVDWLVNRNKE